MRLAVVTPVAPPGFGTAATIGLPDLLRRTPGVDGLDVVRVRPDRSHGSPAVGDAEIVRDVADDYARAARLVSRRGAEAVVVDVADGAFGGADGELLGVFLDESPLPYLLRLRSVPVAPAPARFQVLERLTADAIGILVPHEAARRRLIGSRLAPPGTVDVVPFAAPRPVEPEPGIDGPRSGAGRRWALPAAGRNQLCVVVPVRFGPDDGLLGLLDALGRIRHHDVVTVIVADGTADPGDGERRRIEVAGHAGRLGLSGAVVVDDGPLRPDDVAALLGTADLVVTVPGPGDDADTNAERYGAPAAVTAAIAAGCPVVATPFPYAEDLLGTGAGTLVPFGDSEALATVLADLAEHPDLRRSGREHARRTAARVGPGAVADAWAEALHRAGARPVRTRRPAGSRPALPAIRTAHLDLLCDDVGVVQHAVGGMPNLSTGYCVDDVARLLPCAVAIADRTGHAAWRRRAVLALAFLRHATPERPATVGMHNLLGYDRRWLDHPHHGDHVGRAVRALTAVVGDDRPDAIREPAVVLLDTLCADVADTRPSPRTAAQLVVGLARLKGAAPLRRWDGLVDTLAEGIAALHPRNATDDWDWYEDALAYDNALVPHALILAGHRLDDDRYLRLGLRTLRWYGDQCGLDDPPVVLPGNEGRHRGEPHPGHGGEQPLEAAALVVAELDALAVTGDEGHGRRALRAWSWFTGANRSGRWVLDPATGGCADGIDHGVVSSNQGAESTIEALSARLALDAAGPALDRLGPP